jgi:N-acetylmuramoyl-L-alanine amidase
MWATLVVMLSAPAAPTASLDTAPVATLAYGFFNPLFSPPARRLDDECFIPASQAERIGWSVSISGTKAKVKTESGEFDAFVRHSEGQPYIPVRYVADRIEALSEWTSSERLRVFSKVKSITVKADSIHIEGTLPIRPNIIVLASPHRIVVDLNGARMDPKSPPKISGETRISQFTPETVRVVAQLSNQPKVNFNTLRTSKNSEIKWANAVTTAITPLPTPTKPVTPLTLSPVRIESETPRNSVLKINYSGPMPTELLARRLPDGVIHVDIPNAQFEVHIENKPISSALIKQAVIEERFGGGLKLRIEPVRTMGAKVSTVGSEIVITLFIPTHSFGKISEKILVIDAGHGGHDPGALAPVGDTSLQEKNLTLSIAQDVANILSETGATVLMTRDDDRFIALTERPAIANRNEAQFFLSIHINSNTIANSNSGTFTYYHANDPNAKLLAECIQYEIGRVSGLPDNGVRSDYTVWPGKGFAVLRDSKMPAVLIEIAYINNEIDQQYLKSPEWRKKIADAIVRGVRVYIGDIPKESRQ